MQKAGWGLLGIVVGGVFGCLFLTFVAALCGAGTEDGTLVLMAAMLGVLIGPVVGCFAGIASGQYLTAKLQTATPRYKAGFITTLLIGIVGVHVIPVQSLLHFATPPSDAQLIARFEGYDNELKNPLTAADQRGVIFLIEQEPLTNALGEIHEGGTLPPGEMRFVHWHNRFDISAHTRKGYAFLQKPPQWLLPTLDNTGKIRQHNGIDIAYRHIKGHWYLFYEHQIW